MYDGPTKFPIEGNERHNVTMAISAVVDGEQVASRRARPGHHGVRAADPGVVLFLIVAALALQGVLNIAIDKISTWIAGQNAP